jgi:outer membrane protein assembly factor BamB
MDGSVCALDPATGHLTWRFQTGEGLASGPDFITLPPGAGISEGMAAARSRQQHGKREVTATPIVENGTVLIGSRDHSFYAVDATTGKKRWSFQTGGEIYSRAVAQEGSVYFVSGDGVLYALDASTGQPQWTFETLQGIRSARRSPSEPILKEGTIYITTWPTLIGERTDMKCFLYAIDATSGKAKWTLAVAGLDPSRPTLVDGLILFSTYSNTTDEIAELLAVDVTSGEVRWKSQARTAYGHHTRAFAARGMAFLGSDSGVSAFDLATGAPRWTAEAAVADIWNPGEQGDAQSLYVTTVKGSAAFVGMMVPGTLRALDPTTGKEKWSFQPKGLARVAALRDDAIYLQAGRDLHCLAKETGKKRWSFKMKTWPEALMLISGEMAFIPTASENHDGHKQGVFYAIHLPQEKAPQ